MILWANLIMKVPDGEMTVIPTYYLIRDNRCSPDILSVVIIAVKCEDPFVAIKHVGLVGKVCLP